MVDLVRRITKLENRLDKMVLPEIGRPGLQAWSRLISTHLEIPGLRFFAPMSVIGASGQARDLALGNDLANTANAQFTYDTLAPNCLYNGSTQYHSVADNAAHDILGNEAYIGSGVRGLTMGMWVKPASLPGAATRMFSKGTTTGNARAYALCQNASNQFSFVISSDGTVQFSVADTAAFVAGAWYFVVARFDPSTEIKLWTKSLSIDRTNTNTTSIPATLNNSATGLAIGAQADGTQFSNIRASMCWLSVEMLDDDLVDDLYIQGHDAFGV